MHVLWRPDKPIMAGRAGRVAPCLCSQWQDARIAATDLPVPCSIRQCMSPVQEGAAARQCRATSGSVLNVAIHRCVKPPSPCCNGGHLRWLGRHLHSENTPPVFLSRARSWRLVAASAWPPAPRLSYALAGGGADRLRDGASPGVSCPGAPTSLAPVSAPLVCRVVEGARGVHGGSRRPTACIEGVQEEPQQAHPGGPQILSMRHTLWPEVVIQ
jgi:hypothetical protein